jgi:hypothetical protein
MSDELYLIVLLAVLVIVVFVVPLIAGAFLRFRGTRVITCPETLTHEAVQVDAKHAALTAIDGEPDLRLKSCTRWPERQDCDQRCLLQVELSPEECLVRNMLDAWYAGKHCAVCSREFHHISWADHKPALLSPQGRIIEWSEQRPEFLPDVFETHKPICWDCVVVRKLLGAHPEVVADRSSICKPIVRE